MRGQMSSKRDRREYRRSRHYVAASESDDENSNVVPVQNSYSRKLAPSSFHNSSKVDRTKSIEVITLEDGEISGNGFEGSSTNQSISWLVNTALSTSKYPIESKNDGNDAMKNTNLECFNCGGDHPMKKCREPWNGRRIREARERQFQNPYRAQQTPSSSRGTKGTEVEYGDVMLDRTVSIEMVNLEEGGSHGDSLEGSPANQSSVWLTDMASTMLSSTEPKNVDQPKRFVPDCFNCGGKHRLVNCTEPRNVRRIRVAVAAHRGENENRRNEREKRDSRYHEMENTDGNEKQFTPGIISKELRRALGIGPDAMPEWIYRMRRKGYVHGYPPGYLKKAIVKPVSALLKFHTIDASGEENKHEDVKPPKINPDAIIKYKGFNSVIERPSGCREILRDEKDGAYQVPTLEKFCKYHNDQLKRDHKKMLMEQVQERKREKRRFKRLQRKEGKKAGDVVMLDTSKPRSSDEDSDDCILVDEVIEDGISLDSSVVGSTIPPLTPGSSKSIIVGTPVLHRRKLEAHDVPPTLDAFSKNITPFAPRAEPTARLGFMKKMLQKIKDILPGK